MEQFKEDPVHGCWSSQFPQPKGGWYSTGVLSLLINVSEYMLCTFVLDSQVRKMKVSKCNEIVNRLEKTKRVNAQPDLRAEREQRDREEREDKKKIQRELEQQRREEEKRKREEAELRFFYSFFY